jgi:hypothetical protein
LGITRFPESSVERRAGRFMARSLARLHAGRQGGLLSPQRPRIDRNRGLQ